LLNSLPVWARVGFWLFVGVACAFGVYIFSRLWLTGLPPLELSERGVTGFTKGFGPKRLTIPWDEVSKMQLMQSNLFIYGDAGAQKPMPIVLHLGMVGQKFDVLVAEIEAFRRQIGR
jgi:hypothetical protein